MDKALKQRLVGASVLIILAVIVLPMLLSGRSDTLKQESRQIELPQKPTEVSFETRRFPVGVPQKGAPVDKQNTANKEEPDAGSAGQGIDTAARVAAEENTQTPSEAALDNGQKPITETTAAELNSEKTTDSDLAVAAEPAVKPPAVTTVIINPTVNQAGNINGHMADATGLPRYLVQVASFSSQKRANALASELRAGNMTVVMDVVDRTAGRLHRVRVGPYIERSDADDIVAKILAQDKSLSPRVVDTRPGDASPVTNPSDPLARWVVQVGSYTSAESADAQVASLRLAGLPAFAEKVSNNDGTDFKVWVGPEITRGKAVELADRIKADHHIDGFVLEQE